MAPAKINLFLEVLGKRRDGFHALETVMVTVDLYDTLCFKEGPSGEVAFCCESVHGLCSAGTNSALTLPDNADNLVVRAAELLRRRCGMERGVSIRLRKRIPIGAGLGGGSSDAAATLVGLNRIWKLGLTAEELRILAAEVGSDVAFFLFAPAAVCRGRGEEVRPIQLSQTLHFVIATPRRGLSTAEVFDHCEPATDPKSARRLIASLAEGRLDRVGAEFFNRLQAPAESLCSDVQREREAFGGLAFLGHQMSGSGSAYFGLCSGRRQARALGARLPALGGRVCVVRSSP